MESNILIQAVWQLFLCTVYKSVIVLSLKLSTPLQLIIDRIISLKRWEKPWFTANTIDPIRRDISLTSFCGRWSCSKFEMGCKIFREKPKAVELLVD